MGLLLLEKKGAEWNIVELGYNVMKGTEYLVSLQTSILITEVYNIVVDNDELIGTTEYLSLYAKRRINRCRYNRVPMYMRHVKMNKTNGYCTSTRSDGWQDSERVLNDCSHIRGNTEQDEKPCRLVWSHSDKTQTKAYGRTRGKSFQEIPITLGEMQTKALL